MNRETVDRLFAVALEAAPAARDALLLSEPDETVRSAVRRLLARHDRLETDPAAAGFLTGLDLALAAQLVETGPADPTTIGRFTIVRRLGTGATGVVYLAHDPDLDRDVAIKLLAADLGADPAAVQRFNEEARTASGVDHPHVVMVFETGRTDDDQLFIVMAYHQGETLRQRIKRGALPIDEALAIAAAVCGGLASAHAVGVIHCDIKPENILLTAHGAKIFDFGIARVATRASGRGSAGTVAYMSPEQARGGAVDHRTDIWSLGVVLYEMLTGVRPFTGETADDLLAAVRTADPVPVRRLRRGVPGGVARAVMSCLDKNPEGRPPGAAALRRLLFPRRVRRRLVLGSTGALLAIAAVVVWPEETLPPPPAAESVAVLPFVNLSTNTQEEYLSDGITEDLTIRLGKMEGLKVAPLTAAARYRGSQVDVRKVGQSLGVATVLQGSVRRKETGLRITVQLVDASKGYAVWSETYDRTMGDIFSVQEDIGQAVASTLRLQLTPSVTPHLPSTRNPEAYELYLKGRYFWNQRTEDALVRATGYFHQAVARDSSYAGAWSGLADVETAPRAGNPTERFARAKVAAERALALDSLLPEAHLSLGWVRMWYDRDWPDAERHIRRAIVLRPDYLWANAWYAAYLAAVGRGEESLQAIHHTYDLDPLSYVHMTYVGIHYIWLRRESEALVYFRKALELKPEYFMAHWGLGRVYLRQGRYRQALAEFEYPGGDFAGLHRLGLLGYAHALAGHRAEAHKLLEQFQEETRTGAYVSAIDPALVHLGLGEKSQALDWLERLEEERGARAFFIDPIFDPVRSEPRFQRLLERFGLGQLNTGIATGASFRPR